MSALKASNESEVKALEAQLKSSNDTMQTMNEEMNYLRQKFLTSDKKFSEMAIKNTELSIELSAVKASKHIIESDVKQLPQEVNAQNISCSASVPQDMSSSSSSISSNNQLTTNSDKISDEITSKEILIEIKDQFKYINNMTYKILDQYNRMFEMVNGIAHAVGHIAANTPIIKS
ncbi:unnamed protein product [Medioppia subpectinata]|uniref:Uncharacterized protein n=1 Tax=Medioppia subpectinata TaxID=1979941 RepID=A0A7R9QC46_9ACAR|nr:unnamed protein product [Medioppia subpectinata]CAG2118228.1 unnamed protein product [Medioppia subpectinata]